MKATGTFVLLVAALLWAAVGHAAMIATVPVGNAGNPADTQVMTCCDASVGTSGYGSVDHYFRIGQFAVTNAQYTAFLNAVAATDTFNLYNPDMDDSPHGGILRSGSSGSFTYSTKSAMEQKPVVFVSWFDAQRFANWLHNGQPAGPQDSSTTEDGAYTFTGAFTVGPRNPAARWWLPSEDEWYKAAYHKNDGVTGNYWNYPTDTDDAPSPVLPPGGANSGNFGGVVGTVTDVGAYVDSPSAYNTFDQGGNVWEWNEAVLSTSRIVRGGSWSAGSASLLHAASRSSFSPIVETNSLGFRVATIPEPNALLLAAFGLLAVFLRRRRGAAP